MSKDKKKKEEPQRFGGALADKLKQANLSLPSPNANRKSERTKRVDAAMAAAREVLRAKQELPPAPEEQDGEPMSDSQLFERALGAIRPESIYAGKYRGEVEGLPAPVMRGERRGPSKAERAMQAAEEEAAREAIQKLRERSFFERMVGRVTRVEEADKYHVAPTPTVESLLAKRDDGPRPYSTEHPDSLLTPPMPKSGDGLHRVEALDPSQSGLLKRFKLWAKREAVEVLNVRGDSVEDALRQVELFFHKHWKAGVRYVRVIHGRGINSEDQLPVLKPAVLTWLEGPGTRYIRGYAPELNTAGDYGSVIVQLKQRDP
jgi:DNA-nicking Smr family endonuclease